MEAGLVFLAIAFAFIIGIIVGMVGIILMRRITTDRQKRDAEKKMATMADKTRN